MFNLLVYSIAIAAVFYIGFLIGKMQPLTSCHNSKAPTNYALDIIEPPTIRCPPNEVITATAVPNSCSFTPPTEYHMSKRLGLTQDLIFGYINHATQATKGDIIMTHHKLSEPYNDIKLTDHVNDPFTKCNEVYLMRTGSRESKSPKCGKYISFIYIFIFLLLCTYKHFLIFPSGYYAYWQSFYDITILYKSSYGISSRL